jgi:hypothetical protein
VIASRESASSLTASSADSRLPPPTYAIRTARRFELGTVGGIFIGQWFRRLYEVSLTLSFVGTLWSYYSVAASSLLAIVPLPGLTTTQVCDIYDENAAWSEECDAGFLIWSVAFAVVVISISMLDFTEQVPLQVSLTILRFVVVGLIAILSLGALSIRPDTGGMTSANAKLEADAARARGPPYIAGRDLFKHAGLHIIVSTSAFALGIQPNVGALIAPMKSKMEAVPMLRGALATCGCLYAVLGFAVYLYFGTRAEPLTTLNFRHFPWVDVGVEPPLWGLLLSGVINIFPVFDLLSVFPIILSTLAGNMMSAFGPEARMRFARNRLWRLVFHLVGGLVPLIGANCLRDLDVILEWSAALSAFIAFVAPAALFIAAQSFCFSTWGPTYGRSQFHVATNTRGWAYAVIAFGVAVCAIVYTGLAIHPNGQRRGVVVKGPAAA